MNSLSKILTLVFVVAFISSCQKYAPLDAGNNDVQKMELRGSDQDDFGTDNDIVGGDITDPDEDDDFDTEVITDPDDDEDFDSDKDDVITDPDEDEDFDSEVEGITSGNVVIGGSLTGGTLPDGKPGATTIGPIND